MSGTNDEKTTKSGSAAAMADNLKRAITELCVLHLLAKKECYVGEIIAELEKRSNGFLSLVCPYGLIYRLVGFDYIEELKKRRAPDGRLRQYYQITDKGREYLASLTECYHAFQAAMENVFREEDEHDQ